MATNEILRFAETDTGTNLLTQAEYSADSQRPIGNQPGVARSKLVNKALRQASLIAAGLAEYIADNQGNNVTDGLTPQNIADYLQAAITGALGVTPPQFDNDTSLATTAFVQRALGNYNTAVGVSGTTALTASQIGAFVEIYSGSTGTINLPAVSASISGGAFAFANNIASDYTIVPNGAQVINVNGTGLSSITLKAGESVVLVNDGSSWTVIGGAGKASLGANGYQKLPSGLIIQWGTISTTAVTETVGTFPLAFPNSCFQIVGSSTSAGGESILVYKKTASTFGAQSRTSNTTALNSNTIAWIAIGY